MVLENTPLNRIPKSRAAALQLQAREIIAFWRRLTQNNSALLVVVGLCLLLTVPRALFNGYHYVEGLTVTLSQSTLDDGTWLTPHLYNLRWIERPTLLSWIIAAISLPIGHVTPFMARLPVLLSLVAGVLLVWRALRSVASAEAAIFGAVLVLACPIVMRYYVTAVADVPLAVVLFAAFLVWWNAHARGPVSVARWAGIGGLLAIAALLKGPQPVAYFLLGILIYAMLTSNWRLVPGLALAGMISAIPTAAWYALVFVPGDQQEWLRYTRLSSPGIATPRPFSNAADFFLESFPASLLALALLAVNRTAPRESQQPNFILALSCFTFACTFVILFWPAEVNPRYILPMVLPLCVLGGMAFDALSTTRPALIAASIAIVTCLIGYALVQSAIGVLWKPYYIHTKITGQKIEAMIEKDPGPIYRTVWDAGMNELAYVPRRIMTVDRSAVQSIPKPAWIVVPTGEADALIASSAGHLTPKLALERATLLRWQ